ncbi:MAG: hypothetical protein ACT4QB_00640 [Gammaproteobacteria bacterium]
MRKAAMTVLVLGIAMDAAVSADPAYLVPVAPGWRTRALLTVGESVNDKPDGSPYRMVGIPDGLGAYDNHDGTFTVLMNHELREVAGVPRAHGGIGAFVSQWTIRKPDLKVLHGTDLIKQVFLWDPRAVAYVLADPVTFSRFCAADLPGPYAFFHRQSGNGYPGRIFLNGEESDHLGRAFAHIASGPHTGTSYELPHLGNGRWENVVAHPFARDRTIVVGLDDSSPGQVYLYDGEKSSRGTEVHKAGLFGGRLYGIKVLSSFRDEDRAAAFGDGRSWGFRLVDLGDVSALGFGDLQAASEAAGVTEFLRPEDGAWDTQDPHRFYFVTTDRFDTVKTGSGTQEGRTRLWRLVFQDVRTPAAGGRIEMLLDGTGPYQMFDNLSVNGLGRVILQEDPGGRPYLARIRSYLPDNGKLTELLRFDPARFGDLTLPPTPPFTVDEEGSGVIEITRIVKRAPWFTPNRRYYLGTAQTHAALVDHDGDPSTSPQQDTELVEGGQLYIFTDGGLPE